MKKPILVTGATGFIGKNLTKQLSKNYQIVALVKDPLKAKRVLPPLTKIIKFVLGKREDFPDLPKIETIIHLAADVTYFAPYQRLYKTNVFGTSQLIQALSKSVKHFIYISSIEAAQPKTAYGQTKKEAEELIIKLAQQRKFNYTILRLGNVYGLENPFILLQLKEMMEAKKNYLNKFYPYFKNIKVFPVFIDDVVLAIEKTLEQKIFGQFSLLGQKSYTIEEIVKIIAKVLKISWQEDSSIVSPFVFKTRGFYHRLIRKADFLDYLLNKAEEKEIKKQKPFPIKYKVSLKKGILQIFSTPEVKKAKESQ